MEPKDQVVGLGPFLTRGWIWFALIGCEENIQELCSGEKGVTSPKKGLGFEMV